MAFSFTGPVSLLSYRYECFVLGWLGTAPLLPVVSLPVQVKLRANETDSDGVLVFLLNARTRAKQKNCNSI
jgi:hypothetical protein